MIRYVCFAGAPGSSKTTQIHMLERALPPGDVLIASVPRLLREGEDVRRWLTPRMRQALDDVQSAAASCRARGDLAPLALDHILVRILEQIRDREIVALDAFPRGMAQTFLFLSRQRLWRRAHVMHLRFPGDEREWSLQRQWSRGRKRHGEEWARSQQHVFERKTRVYLEDTVRGIALLREWGVPITTLDATALPEAIHQTAMRALGLWRSGASELRPAMATA